MTYKRITVSDIEYNSVNVFEERVRPLVLHPWQVVVKNNKICFIVPTIGLTTSEAYDFVQCCRRNGINGNTRFCTLNAFEKCYHKNPIHSEKQIVLDTLSFLERCKSYNVDFSMFAPLELIEGESFVDFFYGLFTDKSYTINMPKIIDQYKMNKLTGDHEYVAVLLDKYIKKAVDNYNNSVSNGRPDRAMSFFLDNKYETEDMWQNVPRSKQNRYMWDEYNIPNADPKNLGKRLQYHRLCDGEDTKVTPEMKVDAEGNPEPKTVANPTDISEIKKMAKSNCKTKFVRGRLYKLRIKGCSGSESLSSVYRCVQIVHTIKKEVVNIVVMKLVGDHPIQNHKIYCLNTYDCKKFHIKYEDGLEVFSQLLNWIPTTEPKKVCEVTDGQTSIKTDTEKVEDDGDVADTKEDVMSVLKMSDLINLEHYKNQHFVSPRIT